MVRLIIYEFHRLSRPKTAVESFPVCRWTFPPNHNHHQFVITFTICNHSLNLFFWGLCYDIFLCRIAYYKLNYSGKRWHNYQAISGRHTTLWKLYFTLQTWRLPTPNSNLTYKTRLNLQWPRFDLHWSRFDLQWPVANPCNRIPSWR